MILTKLLFLVLILICAAFYILYIWDFALILLVIMMLLPIVLFVTTFITKKMISVEFALKDTVVPKNEEFPVQLCITNRSIFPVGKAEAHIEYYNVFNNRITPFDIYLPIQPRNTQRVTFQLSSSFCGIVKICCVRISIFDPIRLFKFRTGKNITTEVTVMPESHDIDGSVRFTDHSCDESSTYSENTPGDDPSEVFDLREYVPGDKLNRIHWKLSSKKDEFIVKDYSLPVDVPSAVFLDLKCYEESLYTLPVFDTLIETLISVSQFLLLNERAHTVIFYNGKSGVFTEKVVSDQGTLAEVIRELMTSLNDNLFCQPAVSYFEDNPSLSLASFCYISSAASNDSMSYIDSRLDAEIKNAVIVVRSPEEAASLSGDSSLNVIPVVMGRISASIKDIEM